MLAFLSINVCSKDQVTKINKVFVADEFELYPSSAFVFSDSSQGYASYSIVVDHYIHDETYNVYPVNEAGFNASGIKNLFKRIGKSGIFKRFLESKNIKNIRNWFREMLGMEKVKSGRIRVPPYFSHTKILIKTFEDIKSDEEISGKVSEYLEKVPYSKYNTVQTIKCLRQDADEIRFMMWNGKDPQAISDKIIKVGNETIKLFEYDINNMREDYVIEGGIEYVYFRIPKFPQCVFDGNYVDRTFQCMTFRLPKDADGNWKKFRAFLEDLFSHPMLLLDELRFRKELSKYNIDSRDVLEIEEYLFAKTVIENENSEYVQYEVA